MENSPVPVVERVKISTLKPWPNRTRKHSPRKIQKLAKSMAQIGKIAPAIIDEDSFIMAGHASVEAAVLLGWDEIDVIRVTHLSPAEKSTFVIADNKMVEDGKWDFDALRSELSLIIHSPEGLDLDLSGYEIGEIDSLFQEVTGPLDEPYVPEVPDEPNVLPGQTFQLGEHLLHCGDCLNPLNWKRLLMGETARMALMDPPYNDPIAGHVSTKKREEFAMASGEMGDQEYVEFLSSGLSNAIAHTMNGGVHLIAMDHAHLDHLFAAANPLYSKRLNLIVWSKTNAGLGSLYRSQHELFALYKVGNGPHVNNVQLGKFGRHRTNVWTYPGANTFRKGRAEDLAAHPTVKPLQLCIDAILDLSDPGDIVIDGFGGSGTLILAAEETGRRARVIEYEPGFCHVAIQRWETYTGRKAKLLTPESSASADSSVDQALLPPPAQGGDDD